MVFGDITVMIAAMHLFIGKYSDDGNNCDDDRDKHQKVWPKIIGDILKCFDIIYFTNIKTTNKTFVTPVGMNNAWIFTGYFILISFSPYIVNQPILNSR